MNEDLFHRERRPSRGARAVVLAGVAVGIVLSAASSTVTEKTPFILGNDVPDGSAPPSFVDPPEPDAGDEGRAPLVDYCPSD